MFTWISASEGFCPTDFMIVLTWELSTESEVPATLDEDEMNNVRKNDVTCMLEKNTFDSLVIYKAYGLK